MSPAFHRLTVGRVERLTDDAAAITFAVPPGLDGQYRFAPGQSLTIRRGAERRSYSICAPAGAAPRIAVREVPGGAVSRWLVHDLAPGDAVEVSEPSGAFTPDLSRPGRHVLIAAGSGITPMLSIAASVLAADDKSTVTLLYGNRRSDTVMFADEIADLKDAHPTRMQLAHVLSREQQEVELHSGRLDRDRLPALIAAAVDPAAVDHWWLCGPHGLIEGATEVLAGLGVARDRIHRELFWVEPEPPEAAGHPDPVVVDGAAITVILDGRTTRLTVPTGATILDAAQQVRPDLPFACKGGVCGTCRARLTGGTVRMRRNYALEPAELEAGYVLTCQSVPTSAEVAVDFDA